MRGSFMFPIVFLGCANSSLPSSQPSAHTSVQARKQHMQGAKLAALLAVAGGADPAEDNQGAALRALRAHVLGRRESLPPLQAQGRAAATGLPDYFLVFVLYTVALHPDMPAPAELESAATEDGDPLTPEEVLRPFVAMLQARMVLGEEVLCGVDSECSHTWLKNSSLRSCADGAGGAPDPGARAGVHGPDHQ